MRIFDTPDATFQGYKTCVATFQDQSAPPTIIDGLLAAKTGGFLAPFSG